VSGWGSRARRAILECFGIFADGLWDALVVLLTLVASLGVLGADSGWSPVWRLRLLGFRCLRIILGVTLEIDRWFRRLLCSRTHDAACP
jgi:hypothetical protein